MARLKNKIVCLGFIEKGTGKHMSNSVYSKYGIAPTVMASLGVKQPGIFFVVEDKNGSSEVQKFRSSEDCTDCQRLVNTFQQHSVKNIPARLDKKSGCVDGFASADEQGIYDIGCTVASCVTARYYKGLSAHGDNLVIVRKIE